MTRCRRCCSLIIDEKCRQGIRRFIYSSEWTGTGRLFDVRLRAAGVSVANENLAWNVLEACLVGVGVGYIYTSNRIFICSPHTHLWTCVWNWHGMPVQTVMNYTPACRAVSSSRIVRNVCPDRSPLILVVFSAWCRTSSGRNGLHLSDMSPATSD